MNLRRHFKHLSFSVVTVVVATACSGRLPQPTPVAATATAAPVATLAPTGTRPPDIIAQARPTQTGTVAPLIGLGIMGDSTQDEYAAPENDRPAINWVEHLERSGLPLGEWGSWDDSRRTGYEFNWARSGAVSYNTLHDQAPGLLKQLEEGRVSHVLLQIGINDMEPLVADLYLGKTNTGALDSSVSNIVETARAIEAAAPGRLIVAAMQDYVWLDLIPDPQRASVPDAAGRQRIMEAFQYVNARLAEAIQKEGIYWFDWNAVMADRLSRIRKGDTFTLDGQIVSVRQRGSDFGSAFVADNYMHPGTALSGLYAQLYIEEMNRVWGFDLPPLTDAEILARSR